MSTFGCTRGCLRRAISVSVSALGLLLFATASAEAGAASSGAEQQLADRYAPTVMVRKLANVCNTSQEQFAPPTSVDAVLGNRSVRLMRSVHRGAVLVTRGPTAARSIPHALTPAISECCEPPAVRPR